MNTKINLFSIIIFFFSFNSYSQQLLIDVIAEETCDCINKKNLNLEESSSNDLAATLTTCMFASYQTNIDKFKENEKLNFSDSKQMRGFGEKVGLSMVKYCPNFIIELGKMKDDFGSDEEEVESYESITGKIKLITSEKYLTIKLVEDSGKTTDFFLLNDFDNSYLITDKILKKDDKIEVYFYEIDLYDTKLNKFLPQKIISDIIKE
ncbi:hypothetical protein FLGE108171_02000 [Flavobacterium gelidilacus]|uniref:hypothetical protein n=1 Tax=Flavobacterium gelidilacus TaxID=206041 RepID=UPI00047A9FD0|nr:hypothetical protein [Flavobacterium gelidilacus]